MFYKFPWGWTFERWIEHNRPSMFGFLSISLQLAVIYLSLNIALNIDFFKFKLYVLIYADMYTF